MNGDEEEIGRCAAAANVFDVDGSLGRLAKWLRILGFDAAYPVAKPLPDRFFLTASVKRTGECVILVRAGQISEDLKRVVTVAGLALDPDRFLSRCLICNVLVKEVSRKELNDEVPEEVRRHFTRFTRCPGCSKVYWAGTHSDRIMARIADMGLRPRTGCAADEHGGT